MTEQPTTPYIIKDPFNKDFDVTDDTPIADLPEGYQQRMKERTDVIKTELEKIQQGIEGLSVDPDIEEMLIDEAHLTISKFDDHIIKAAFHVGLSAYLDPLNLALKCESGSGKTYSTNETMAFLPQEDIQYIASQSPKVISHECGVRKSESGENIDELEEPEKPVKKNFADDVTFENALINWKKERKSYSDTLKHSYYEVDVRNKVIVFQESINLETFKMFKTTMSKDKEYADHKYVDDHGNVHVTKIVGAPALIFNSLDNDYFEEQATREFTASPLTTQPKIEDSMRISNLKKCYPWIYKQHELHRKIIQEYIRKIKFYITKGKIKVATPFDGIYEAFTKTAIRDMRDFNKFLELMPSYSAFKLFQRPIIIINEQRYLIPTIQDALDAKIDYDNIILTTKTSTESRILEFYYNVLANCVNGAEAEDLTDIYNKDRKQKVATVTVRGWLVRLEKIGWADIREGTHKNDKGYIDRRYNNYIPLKPKKNASTLDFDSTVHLEEILEKSFNKWLENTLSEIDTQEIIILNIDGTAKRISLEDMCALITKKNTVGISNIDSVLSKDISNSINENKAKNTIIQETIVDAHISNETPTPPIANTAEGESEVKYIHKDKTVLKARRIKPRAGVLCIAEGCGGPCTKEAEWYLDGNILCPEHFLVSKKTCQENDCDVQETS
ncbi:MAG: hypothetical protein ABSF44_15415 [Candidatus Bathyarchaeia archaeon]